MWFAEKQTRPTLDGQTIHGIEFIQSRLEETTQTDSEKLDDDEEINLPPPKDDELIYERHSKTQ
jgi:hypothetical protein